MKHPSPDDIKKDLEILLSKLDALEAEAKDSYQRGIVQVLRALVSHDIHSVNEMGHIKKALDLVTLQAFKT